MRRRDYFDKQRNGPAKPSKPKEEEKTVVDFEEYLKNPLEKFKTDLKTATTSELSTEGYS